MSKNKNGTFSFKDVNGVEQPSLLMREVFKDIESNCPELLLGRVNYKDVVDSSIERVRRMLPPKDAELIFDVNKGAKTVGTWFEHLSKLGQYDNGLKKRNEEVIDMYIIYKKG